MQPLHCCTISALCRALKLVVHNVSRCNPQRVLVFLKQSAFMPEHSVPFSIVYADNPKYASKKSVDSLGINTFLCQINIFSQEGMQKSI